MTLSLELWLPPLVAGLGLLLLSACWRMVARDRRRRGSRAVLRAALADPDPLRRLAAVQVAVQQGISPVAAELLAATATERDPAVLEGITAAVARHQWEPSLEPELLELRLWAQRRLVELQQQRPPDAPTNGHAHEPIAAPVAAPAPAPGGVIRWLPPGRARAPRTGGQG